MCTHKHPLHTDKLPPRCTHVCSHTQKCSQVCIHTCTDAHTHVHMNRDTNTYTLTYNDILCLFLFHTGTHKQIHADTHRHSHRHTQPHRIHTQRTALIYRSLWIFFMCMIFCFWINWMSRRKHFKKLTEIDLWLLHRNLTFHQMSSYGIEKFKLVLKLSLKHEYSFEIIMH